MSFLRSLFSGVSGLTSHQIMMDVIGNNIANINTIGFKKGVASFSELYAQTLRGGTQSTDLNGGQNPIQVGLGTTVGAIDNIFTEGSVQTTDVKTDLAIQGSGFFIVKENGNQVYTRAGQFSIDGTGKLESPSGAVLQGKLADLTGTIPQGTSLQDLKISLDTKSPAKATQNLTFAGNLDSSAVVGATTTSSAPVYDSLGNKYDVTLSFQKTGPNAWSWTAGVPAPSTTTSNGTVSFNSADGTLNSLTPNLLTIDAGGGAPPFNITLGFGTPTAAAPGVFSGITQTAGASLVSNRAQDGYTAGSLNDISVDNQGRIIGSFSNSTKITLGQVMLAEFNNPGGLLKSGENTWDASGNSGTAAIVNPGGSSTILSSALEQSNVDLSDEFTKMITAQRGFQANARVITTSDEFLQELVNLKR